MPGGLCHGDFHGYSIFIAAFRFLTAAALAFVFSVKIIFIQLPGVIECM